MARTEAEGQAGEMAKLQEKNEYLRSKVCDDDGGGDDDG